MATYAIGDIQGCATTLQLLLERIGFDASLDHLIIVGDLVNRGPSSLEALRWAYAHRRSITMVLGNHDVALLAHAAGVRPLRPKDTLAEIMAAQDKGPLLQWLKSRPFAHVHERPGGKVLALHAGVLPTWRLTDVMRHAQAAQRALQGPHSAQFLAALESQAAAPAPVRDAVEAARVLTYLRALEPSGEPHFAFKGPTHALREGAMPWFAAPHRHTQDTTIVCGHWAALGLHVGHNIRALDTGCVWGGKLTAYCLDTEDITQVPYGESTAPLTTLSD